jgi:hypothetical protein
VEKLLTLLQAHTRSIVNRNPIALQNWEAAQADADAIAQALDAREAGHIEFSMFTGHQGRS